MCVSPSNLQDVTQYFYENIKIQTNYLKVILFFFSCFLPREK